VEKTKLLKILRDEVAALHDSVYSSAGDAFAHVAVREYFDLDDEDALEACDVGGSRDKGIDAFWFDDEERRALLVQTKWADTSKSFGAPAVREAEAAYKWLLRIAEGKGGEAAPRVIDAARQLYKLREAEPDYPVSIFVIVAGTFTKGAKEEQARVEEDLKREPVEITLVNLDDLLIQVEERLSRDTGEEEEKPDVTFTLQDDGYFEHGDDGEGPQALVATLSGYELADVAHTWGYKLFMRNLRFFLPGRARGSVNEGIRTTLASKEGRQRFWYYNNGIAIVCDSFEVDPEAGTVKLSNMQIVNGAQTTTTLSNCLELLRNDPQALLLARIIAEPEEELRQNITYFNNRQNAVKDRDLMSNDLNQDRLQHEFLQRDPPWFYERKRGEWVALTKRDAELKKSIGKNKIDNERAAQAAYAVFIDAARARADKKNLFQPRKDGGYYEDVFNDSTTTAWLLLPFRTADYVGSKKNEYLRSIRGIDPRKATVQQARLLSKEWVKFADQYILGTIGLYLQLRGGIANKRLEELLGGDFDGMVKGAYAAAVRDLQPLFTRKQREAAAADLTFSPANYVKGNWEEARDHIGAEWEARSAVGDPLEGVPMLSEDDVS
jgi:AIPR protein